MADSTTALRLSRAMELARWRSPRTWVMVAVLPLVIMARHIFDLVTGASPSDSGVLGILGVYFALLVLAVVIVALIAGVRMMKRNPLVTAYASAGMAMGVRYFPGAMEVSLATGIRIVDYAGIKDVAFIGRSVFIRPENGDDFAIPRELVAEFAVDLLRSGGVGPQTPSGGTAPTSQTNGRSRRPLWVVPVLTAAAVIAVAVGLLTTVGIVAANDNGDGRTSIAISATTDHVTGGGMVLDPATRTLYVTNIDSSGYEDTGTLAVVDLAGNTLTATIPLPEGTPRGIALDPGTHTVYVLSASRYAPTGSGVVSIIDTATNTLTAKVPIDRKSSWLALDENTHTAYVLNTNDAGATRPQHVVGDSLSAIPSGATVANDPVPIGPASKGIVIDSKTAYVPNILELQVIDLATQAPITSVPMPFSIELMLFDHDTRTIFAVSEKGEIAVIDAGTARVTKTIDAVVKERESGKLGFEGLTVDSTVHTLYLSNSGDDTVTAIDTTTGAVTDTLPVRRPNGLVVDPFTHTLYAYSAGNLEVFPRQGS